MSRKLSQGYLERAAFHYLGRYSSSVKNLKRILERKAMRRLEEGEKLTADHYDWIDAVIVKCESYGYVNDLSYAKSKVKSMHGSGKSKRGIIAALMAKGVSRDDIDLAIGSLEIEDGVDPDRLAAEKYARKRRFGPYRTREADEDKQRKEAASMARVGFSYDIIKQVLGGNI